MLFKNAKQSFEVIYTMEELKFFQISLNDQIIELCFSIFPNLQKIFFHGVKGINFNFKFQSKIQEIRLSYMDGNIQFRPLLQGCPGVEKLQIRNCKQLLLNDLSNLVPNLTSIEVSDMMNLFPLLRSSNS